MNTDKEVDKGMHGKQTYYKGFWDTITEICENESHRRNHVIEDYGVPNVNCARARPVIKTSTRGR